jgi:TolB-like protein
MKKPFALLGVFSVILISALPAFAQKVNVAVLGVANTGGDPRQEYLAGIIQGVLLYDLSSQPSIAVVDRSHMEDVLREQELQLSGIMDQGKAVAVGRLLGADYLLRVDYIFLGTEVQTNAALINVASGQTVSFTDRGNTENLIHGLSEKIILKLTGKTVALRSPQREFSILSLSDEKPGSIALYVGLVDAEIFMDGDFVGYSGQDTRQPFMIESAKPGAHVLRIKLPRFGVVSLPDYTLHDWEQTVVVKPGDRTTVRANARHFNEIVYPAITLLNKEYRFKNLPAGPQTNTYDLSFTDTKGNKIAASIEVTVTSNDGLYKIAGTLTYNGAKTPFGLEAKSDADKKLQVGETELYLNIDFDWGEVSYTVRRTDIWQNMDIGEERE